MGLSSPGRSGTALPLCSGRCFASSESFLAVAGSMQEVGSSSRLTPLSSGGRTRCICSRLSHSRASSLCTRMPGLRRKPALKAWLRPADRLAQHCVLQRREERGPWGAPPGPKEARCQVQTRTGSPRRSRAQAQAIWATVRFGVGTLLSHF